MAEAGKCALKNSVKRWSRELRLAIESVAVAKERYRVDSTRLYFYHEALLRVNVIRERRGAALSLWKNYLWLEFEKRYRTKTNVAEGMARLGMQTYG